MRKALILFTFIGSLIFAARTQAVTSSSVTLAWNPSSSPNIAGYKVYYGTSSGNYISAVPISNVTNVTIRGLAGGTTYYFAATSYDSSGDESAFSPEISDTVGSTIITSGPANQTVAPGQTATFSVTAVGTDLSYQWTFDGNPISGATDTVLTLNAVSANQAGNYAVNVLSSGAGAASSAPATLTVYSAASATLAQTAASPGQFSFSISGVPGGQYAVQASTNLVDWITLQTNVAPFNFVDSNASRFSRRFYRTVYISN